MRGSLFAAGGVWLRCQLHAHTANSDGKASPAELCEHYASARFDVLAVTDHWGVTTCEHDGLVLVPASELSAHAPSAHGEAEALYGDDAAAELAALEAGTHPLQRREPAAR